MGIGEQDLYTLLATALTKNTRQPLVFLGFWKSGGRPWRPLGALGGPLGRSWKVPGLFRGPLGGFLGLPKGFLKAI